VGGDLRKKQLHDHPGGLKSWRLALLKNPSSNSLQNDFTSYLLDMDKKSVSSGQFSGKCRMSRNFIHPCRKEVEL